MQILPFSDDSAHGICRFRRFLTILSTEFADFAVFHSGACSDEQKLGDSAHCRPTTSSFSHFFRFVGRRQTLFIVFCISSADDGRFFPFSVLRPRPKRSFSCFSSFGHGRKPTFRVFYSSAMAETQFFPFSARRPRPKYNFPHFPLVGHGRNAVFTRFPIKNCDFFTPDG